MKTNFDTRELELKIYEGINSHNELCAIDANAKIINLLSNEIKDAYTFRINGNTVIDTSEITKINLDDNGNCILVPEKTIGVVAYYEDVNNYSTYNCTIIETYNDFIREILAHDFHIKIGRKNTYIFNSSKDEIICTIFGNITQCDFESIVESAFDNAIYFEC